VPWERGTLLIFAAGHSIPDSLAIDADGNVCVADIPHGGISVVSPEALIERVAMPERCPPTSVRRPDLRTAYITLSSTGSSHRCVGRGPELPLHFLESLRMRRIVDR
jgi:gluconolactonase